MTLRAIAPGASGSGTPVGTSNFVVGATPTGTINGTDGTDGNPAFTIQAAPLTDANGNPIFELFKTDVGTAVGMVRGVHYNLSGTTITYTSGNIPITGQTHRYNETIA